MRRRPESYYDDERERIRKDLVRRQWEIEQRKKAEHEELKRKKIEEYEKKRAEEMRLSQGRSSFSMSYGRSSSGGRSNSRIAADSSQKSMDFKGNETQVSIERLTIKNSSATTQEISKCDIEELSKITVKIQRKMSESESGSQIKRDIDHDKVELKRRQGEGQKPIFERAEIQLPENKKMTEEDKVERRLVTLTIPKKSDSLRRSTSESPRRRISNSPRSESNKSDLKSSSHLRSRSRSSERHHVYRSHSRRSRSRSQHRSRSDTFYRRYSEEEYESKRYSSHRRSHSRDDSRRHRSSRSRSHPREYRTSRDQRLRRSDSDREHTSNFRGTPYERQRPRNFSSGNIHRMPYVETMPYPAPIPPFFPDFIPRPMMIRPLGLPFMPVPGAPIRPLFPRFAAPHFMAREPLPRHSRYG